MLERQIVLVVDDDEAILRSLVRCLRHESRRVLTANSAQEAIDRLKVENIDVVITDDQMPGTTGRQLLQTVRNTHPDAMRILMTGHASLEAAIEVFNQEEAHRYLPKPIDVKTLLEVVDGSAAKIKDTKRVSPVPKENDRQSRIAAALEHEYPGLTVVGPGPHTPRRTPTGERLLSQVRRLFHPGVSSDNELADLGIDVCELADQLLLIPMEYPRSAVVLEPGPTMVRVVIDTGRRNHTIGTISSSRGDAVVARLALLAQLNLSNIGEQLGAVALSIGQTRCELSVALRTSAIGLSIEMRRLFSPAEVEQHDHTALSRGERYQMLKVLGEGAGGIVYLALHTDLERRVAMKVLRGSAAHDPTAAARLHREARAASRARSNGIVEVLDYGMLPDQRPFIVMELIEAPTLETRLELGPLAIEAAIKIARNLALAIGAAHDVGVVHRDLKPSNIFVDDDHGVKISDFGAAKLVNESGPSLTQEGMTIGTPHYMSPEQGRGEPIDRRSDIYALGCVLFEMLAGHPPFERETSIAVLAAHMLDPVPKPVSPFGPLPIALSRTISRAMAKERVARHQNTGELIADLEQASSSIRREGWRRWLP